MDRKAVFTAVAVVALLASAALQAQEGDPYTLETMTEFNGGLKALWMDIQVEQIEAVTVGRGRLTSRLHYQPFRWVANDARRLADGSRLTYLISQERLAGSGLIPGTAEAAIDRAMRTWTRDLCFRKVGAVKRKDEGPDPDIFDALLGYGGFGDYRMADIVHAGWMPPAFFDAVGGPGSGSSMLAISVTFIYVGLNGKATDVNGDGFLDIAHNEVYYNSGFSWQPGAKGSMDVETVALHEAGHALGLGHMDPPLEAAMNPIYGGIKQALKPLDSLALCLVWARWPK